MNDFSNSILDMQYFQIAFLDDENWSKEGCLSRGFSKKKFLTFQKKNLKSYKGKKIKKNLILNSFLKEKYSYYNFIIKNLKNVNNIIFSYKITKLNSIKKKFLKLLKLKLRRRKTNTLFVLDKNVSYKIISNNFLNYWYEYFYSLFLVPEIKISKTNLKIKSNQIKVDKFFYFYFKNVWKYSTPWLGIDLENIQPLIEIGDVFFFRKLIYHFFFKKLLTKRYLWLSSFRKFSKKENQILKRDLTYLDFKKFKKAIIYTALSENYNKYKRVLKRESLKQSHYFYYLEKNIFKIYLTLKIDTTTYRNYIHRKWYFTRKISTFFFKSKHTLYLNNKERFLIKRASISSNSNKPYVTQKYIFSDMFSVLNEDSLKLKSQLKNYYEKIFLRIIDFKKYKSYMIEAESNILLNFFLKNSNYSDFTNLKKIYKVINYGYHHNIPFKKNINFFNLKLQNYQFSKNIKHSKSIVNHLLVKKHTVKNNFLKNNFLKIKKKYLDFKSFYKYIDNNVNNIFFQKKFEKLFYFFYFTPMWSLINDLQSNKLYSYFVKVINLNVNANIYNSNIFLEAYENSLKFNINRYIQKTKPILRLTKIIETQLLMVLENFMQRNVFLQTNLNLNLKHINKTNFIENMYRKLYSMQVFFGKNFFLKEMIEVFIWFFKFKDLSIFETWFIKAMHKLPAKKHRKFLLFLKSCICNYFNPLFNASGLKGFFMRVSGKISVTGNAKTRSQYIKWGVFGTSKKDNKIDLTQNIIRTNTGVLGILMIISY